eukprot:128597_1
MNMNSSLQQNNSIRYALRPQNMKDPITAQSVAKINVPIGNYKGNKLHNVKLIHLLSDEKLLKNIGIDCKLSATLYEPLIDEPAHCLPDIKCICGQSLIKTTPKQSYSHMAFYGNFIQCDICKDKLYFFSENGALDWKISLNGCNECDSPSSCIDNWYFFCDTLIFSEFYGDTCNSIKCNCMHAINTINSHLSNDFGACNLISYDYECDPGTECIIDCTNQFIDGCYQKAILAYYASSVHVICNGTLSNPLLPYGACQSTYIYCPVSGVCNIECLNNNGCYETQIIFTNPLNINAALNLTCVDSDSCLNTIVHGNDGNNISINCISYDSCHHITVNGNTAQNIAILCDSGTQSSYSACNDFTVYAINVTDEIKLICNGDHSCYFIDIYANYSNNVVVYANGDYAAYDGNIFAQNASNMRISCTSRYLKYGCYEMDFYISSEWTSIECQGYGCYYLSLYSETGFSSIKNVSVNGCNYCDSVNHCINSWYMHCNYQYAAYYDGYYCSRCSYCQYQNFPTVMSNAWNTKQESCDISTPDLSCASDNCTITCSSNSECVRDTIFGNNATSMTVICGQSSCESATIYCSESSSNQCNIICDSYRSCASLKIYGGRNSIVNLNCGYYGCIDAGVFVYETFEVNIQCLSSSSCDGMNVHGDNVGTININCTDCYNINIHGDDANVINMNCTMCDDMNIYGNNAKNIFVHAFGSHSLFESTIYAVNSSNFTFWCESVHGNNGCENVDIYLPPNQKATLRCTGYGCYNLGLYSIHGMNDIKNIWMNGDNQCLLPELCIQSWHLYCGISYSTMAVFTGGSCTDSGCDCDDLTERIDQVWPFDYVPSATDIICADQNHCNITCGLLNCQNKIIYGNKSLSLTVNCYASNACQNTVIYCPNTTNSWSVIHCGYSSCHSSVIIGYPNSKIYIDASSYQSFANAIIHAHESNEIVLNCSDTHSCSDVFIHAKYTETMNISCFGPYGCSGMVIFASSIQDKMMLNCIDTFSCSEMTIHAENAQNVKIFGIGGMYNASINVKNANNFSLTCIGRFAHNGCYGARIYFPPSERINLYCFGYGCYRMYPYISNGMKALKTSNINFNGCGKCLTPHDCISEWKIHCDLWYSYDTYTTFNGLACTSYIHSCNCTGNKDFLSNIFINDVTVTQCTDIISSLTCGDTVTGVIVSGMTDDYILEINSLNHVVLDSCLSNFDTELYLYYDGNLVSWCDDCGSCGLRTLLTSFQQLQGNFTLRVAGHSSSSAGDYTVSIGCSQQQSNVYNNFNPVYGSYNLIPSLTIDPTPTPTSGPVAGLTMGNMSKIYCGTNIHRWCYYVDVYPGSCTTRTMIPIQAIDDSSGTYFEIYWRIKESDCVSPAITLRYEQIDISTSYENIIVYSDSGTQIENCQGNNLADSQCNVWWTCFTDKLLPDSNTIFKNDIYKITLYEGSQTDNLCSHQYSMNAQLFLRCNGTNPTMDPTMDPTAIPTNNPLYHPTMDPTAIPTNNPLYHPTIDPTEIPTNNPLYHPTMDPTAIPTNNPSNDPNVNPTNNPSNDPNVNPT